MPASYCPACGCRLMAQDVIAHMVEVEGIAPTQEPALGDPVWSEHTSFRLSVRQARQHYSCQGCTAPIQKGALHAGMARSSLHFCLACSGFAQGVRHAERSAA